MFALVLVGPARVRTTAPAAERDRSAGSDE
jgi:hypothetical protein